MKIVQISVANSGVNHDYAVFGLGDDGNVYQWHAGEWTLANL